MVPFKIISIQETTDDMILVEWETLADDGHRLVEQAEYSPKTGDVEAEVTAWLQERRERREHFNNLPKPEAPERKIRPPRVLNPVARDRLMQKFGGDE